MKQKPQRKTRRGHAAVTKEQREMFWKYIARKGGLHIRF